MLLTKGDKLGVLLVVVDSDGVTLSKADADIDVLGVSLADSDDVGVFVSDEVGDTGVVVLMLTDGVSEYDRLGVSLVVIVTEPLTLSETELLMDGEKFGDSMGVDDVVSDVTGELLIVVEILGDSLTDSDGVSKPLVDVDIVVLSVFDITRLGVSLVVTVTEPLTLSDTVLLVDGDKLDDSEDVGVLVSVAEGDTDNETLGVSLADSDGVSEADDEILVDVLMAIVSEDDKLGVSLAEALILSETVRELELLDIPEVLADIEGEATYGVSDDVGLDVSLVEADTEGLTLCESVLLMDSDKFGVDVDVLDVFISAFLEGETDAEPLMVVDKLGVSLVVIVSDVLIV